MAALNITPRKGTLDFGEKSGKNMQTGMMFLVFSIALIIVDCYCVLKLNSEVKREKEGFKPAGRSARYAVDEED